MQTDLPLDERPRLAILPFGIDVKITTLASVKSVEKKVAASEEEQLLAQALQEIRNEARWLIQSRVATGMGFRMVSLEATDAAVAKIGLNGGELPTPAQLAALRTQLGADLVLVGSILDYGQVRWQWLAAGLLTDITAETVVIGLASSWNPAFILGNVGFELLTSTPIWFGGGYLFGVALRPVRVESRVLETDHGEIIWQDQEEAFWGRGRLKQFPETERSKKENQLYVNLSKVMEELADSLNDQAFTVSGLRDRH